MDAEDTHKQERLAVAHEILQCYKNKGDELLD